MKQFPFLLSLAACTLLATAQPHTNNRSVPGTARLAAYKQHETLSQNSPYKNLQWRQTGPNYISGRVTDVWGIPGNKNVMYAALATSGLWKTTDAGLSWQPLFDKQPTLNMGTMAIAQSNHNILYAGTGEANIFRASLPGMGMFKSTDAGKTWTHIGLENTGTISRVVIHPTNPDVVYVAAGGHEWSHNPERGVYLTTDGGKTWKRILAEGTASGCNDLLMDPNDPNTLYASMWNRIRKRWSDPIPEDSDYLYKSTDAGKTWKRLTNGLPETKYTGRIGLAMSKKNSNVVYAFIDNHTPKREPKPGELDPYGRPIQIIPMGVQVWRSNDKGESWSKVSTEDEKLERFAGTYGWVFSQIRVDPNDENTVYIMGVPFAKSTDGGKNLSNHSNMGQQLQKAIMYTVTIMPCG
jgi:BNR/Asp-box repeat.